MLRFLTSIHPNLRGYFQVLTASIGFDPENVDELLSTSEGDLDVLLDGSPDLDLDDPKALFLRNCLKMGIKQAKESRKGKGKEIAGGAANDEGP